MKELKYITFGIFLGIGIMYLFQDQDIDNTPMIIKTKKECPEIKNKLIITEVNKSHVSKSIQEVKEIKYYQKELKTPDELYDELNIGNNQNDEKEVEEDQDIIPFELKKAESQEYTPNVNIDRNIIPEELEEIESTHKQMDMHDH